MITESYIDKEIKEILDREALSMTQLDILYKLSFVKVHIGQIMSNESVFTSDMATDWVNHMKNSDGSVQGHWTKDQTDAVLSKAGYHIDPWLFYAVMNSLYSDYGETLMKHGVTAPEAFAELARDWIMDEDSVKSKASGYYTYIVNHK